MFWWPALGSRAISRARFPDSSLASTIGLGALRLRLHRLRPDGALVPDRAADPRAARLDLRLRPRLRRPGDPERRTTCSSSICSDCPVCPPPRVPTLFHVAPPPFSLEDGTTPGGSFIMAILPIGLFVLYRAYVQASPGARRSAGPVLATATFITCTSWIYLYVLAHRPLRRAQPALLDPDHGRARRSFDGSRRARRDEAGPRARRRSRRRARPRRARAASASARAGDRRPDARARALAPGAACGSTRKGASCSSRRARPRGHARRQGSRGDRPRSRPPRPAGAARGGRLGRPPRARERAAAGRASPPARRAPRIAGPDRARGRRGAPTPRARSPRRRAAAAARGRHGAPAAESDGGRNDEAAATRSTRPSSRCRARSTELRELARGIHPAVLTDQGLDAAVRTLAERAPIPVDGAATRPSGFRRMSRRPSTSSSPRRSRTSRSSASVEGQG